MGSLRLWGRTSGVYYSRVVTTVARGGTTRKKTLVFQANQSIVRGRMGMNYYVEVHMYAVNHRTLERRTQMHTVCRCHTSTWPIRLKHSKNCHSECTLCSSDIELTQ